MSDNHTEIELVCAFSLAWLGEKWGYREYSSHDTLCERIQLNPGIQQKAAVGTVQTEQALTLPREQGPGTPSITCP